MMFGKKATAPIDLGLLAASLAETVGQLKLLRAADVSRDRQIALQKERIRDLLKSNNELLARARASEANVRALQEELNRRH